MNMIKELILASQSPRRKELLEKCGIPFSCDPADLDESIDTSASLTEEIRRLALRKAEEVFRRHPQATVIGSDTVVAVDGEVLGKPADDIQAAEMIRKLQGRTHQVITGLAIISKNHRYTDISVSDVTFSKMSEEEIRLYVASGECRDKAGAYAIQGLGGRYVTEIRGDYYSIMGLPLHLVYAELQRMETEHC